MGVKRSGDNKAWNVAEAFIANAEKLSGCWGHNC